MIYKPEGLKQAVGDYARSKKKGSIFFDPRSGCVWHALEGGDVAGVDVVKFLKDNFDGYPVTMVTIRQCLRILREEYKKNAGII